MSQNGTAGTGRPGGDSLVLLKKFRLKIPDSLREFPYRRVLSWEQYQRASRGLAPAGPEDKWLVLCRGGRLHFFRSGNGVLVFRVSFANRQGAFPAGRAEVNADSAQLLPQPDRYEACLLDYLIDTLLLGRRAKFPAPPGTDGERAAMLERLWMGRAAQQTMRL
ncbi:MAG: hypothetical protein FVQ81_12500 [Candidatus Glassbacteria bacterium]|nr:hypothetical protein [Candidatus Glassbacteria bacterium]